jgi:hypothetical protein
MGSAFIVWQTANRCRTDPTTTQTKEINNE